VYQKQNLPLSRKLKWNGQNVDVLECLLRKFQQAGNLNLSGYNFILEEKASNLT